MSRDIFFRMKNIGKKKLAILSVTVLATDTITFGDRHFCKKQTHPRRNIIYSTGTLCFVFESSGKNVIACVNSALHCPCKKKGSESSLGCYYTVTRKT